MRNYRGLTKDGKWVYGWYVNNPHGNTHIIIEPIDYAVEDRHDVIPETVGRYTGLKDIDKTEIYASDKIETPNWGTVAVEWSEEKAMYGFWYTSNWGKSWCSLWKAQGDCKVIGNIHQEVKI